MKNYTIAVHAGAGDDSDFFKSHETAIVQGLTQALECGLEVLAGGGTALGAVEASIAEMEDNPLFNAGRGAALNHKGEIEMDASIMCGRRLASGAVSMVRNARNPISLARYILENTSYVFMSAEGAMEFAKSGNMQLEPESYFVTGHQVEEFIKARDTEKLQDILRKRIHGTVGAVALDSNGNLASGTSTGGTKNCLSGRIGDSSIIGAGCLAQDGIAAISATGDGEIIINRTIASSLAAAVEYLKMDIQAACDYIVHERNQDIDGDLGVIAVDPKGQIGMAFNSKRMPRAWIDQSGNVQVQIYS